MTTGTIEPMASKVYLHVGAPKTGTTYLQDRLARNAASLARHGVHYPAGQPLGDPSLFQFRAAVDLLGKEWRGPGEKSAGRWERLAKRVRASKGTVVVSHELLVTASAEKIAQAKRDLVGPGTELHVVYSARDLARQVPAAWQESVKQGQVWSYRRFCNRLQRRAGWFGKAFDLPAVLGAWGEGLPPEQVHVLTVPQSRQGDELWHRFCRLVGADPAWAPRDTDRVNPSLGAVEVAMLRRLNWRLDRRSQAGAYDYLVRELMAERELAGRAVRPVRLPERMRPWVEEETERWIAWIEESGVDVVGDLDELRPLPAPDEPFFDPDKPGAKAQLIAALDALAAITQEAERRPDPDRQLVAKVRRRLQERFG